MDEKNRIEAVHKKVMELIQITNDLEALLLYFQAIYHPT